MSLLDDIIFGFSGTPSEEATSTTLGIIGFLFWVAIIIGAVIGGFLLFRMLWLKFQYEGHFEIAPFRFIWMGKFGEIEGNLSLSEAFDDEEMEMIEQHTEVKFAKEVVKEQIKNKKLFIYNFKITDEGDVLEDFSRKVRLISPVDLTLPRFTWLDSKGKRNLGSIVRREKRRNVVLYHTTQRFTVLDEDRNDVEYWIVSPVPMVDAKTVVQWLGNPIKPVPTHYIDIIKLEGGRALGQLAELRPILDEAIKKFTHVLAEKKNYEKLYNDEVEAHERTNMEKENLKHQKAQKMYVGDDEKPVEPVSKMNAGWIIGTAVTVFFMVVVLPEFLVSLDLIIAQFIAFGIGTALMIFMWAWLNKNEGTITDKQEMKTSKY